MKNKTAFTLVAIVILFMIFPITAYANSSWHWLTKTRPLDVLPYVVILTLAIEYFTIKKANSINQSIKLFLVVCFANAISFLLPYVILFIVPDPAGYTFEMLLKNLPTYSIGIGYLFLTLVAEVPIVFICFMNNVKSKKNLFVSIILVNVATTVMVAVIERIICRGSW
jgi:hypothetical protein